MAISRQGSATDGHGVPDATFQIVTARKQQKKRNASCYILHNNPQNTEYKDRKKHKKNVIKPLQTTRERQFEPLLLLLT